MGFLTEEIINSNFRKEIATPDQNNKGSSLPFQFLTSKDFNFLKNGSLFIIYNQTGSEVIDIPLLNQKTNSPDSC